MNEVIKYVFDRVAAFFGLVFFFPFLIIIAFLIVLDGGFPVIFKQKRIGKNGSIFTIYKFRTMGINASGSTVSVKGDYRITPIGAELRRWKLDELPELWNVFIGQMSFVGPRPDVPGYADKLEGDDRRVLQLRPGISGPASLKYSNEEELLEKADDPVKYNDEVIFPDKVRINLEYLDNMNFITDMKIIFKTIFRTNY